MIAFLWNSLVDTRGKPAPWLTWDDLFREFEKPAGAFRGQKDHPGWSAAVFDPPHRAEVNVRHVSALVLDYDGTATIDAAAETWAGNTGLLHTSKRHTEGDHRFRVILPFQRVVSPFEYAAIWRRADLHAAGKIDAQAKDPSRFWYLPCVDGDGPYETRRLGGKRLDPDEWLRKPEPTVPLPRVDVTANVHGDVMRRASAYLAKMPPAISGSEGHKATFRAAIALRGFGLDESAIFGLLWNEYNPRCQPPWAEKELRHKARQAVNNSRAEPGSKLAGDEERYREWVESTSRSVNYGAATDPDPDYVPEPPDDSADNEREPGADREPGEDDEGVNAVGRYGVVTVKEAFHCALARAQSRERAVGFTTGHFELDEMIGGIRRSRVVTVGATTNWGKSSFAIMVVDENDQRGVRCLIVSGEDSRDLYENRLVCRRAGIHALKLRDGECSDADVRAISLFEARAMATPFVLPGVGKPVEMLTKAIREVIREEGIQLVVVDYLQCFRFQRRAQDRRNEVTDVARAFGDAIKGEGAAAVFLSQLRRLENPNHVPSMHDLKESGDIENESDHILIGYWRDHETDQEKRYISVEKNKDGPVSSEEILMPFDKRTASFVTTKGQVYRKYDDGDESLESYVDRIAP